MSEYRFKVGDKVYIKGIVGKVDYVDTVLPYKIITNNGVPPIIEHWYADEQLMPTVNIDKTYEQGLEDGENEALRIIKKLGSYDGDVRVKIFNNSDAYHNGWCLDNYTLKEILSAIESYEADSSLKVGDEVTAINFMSPRGTGVVTRICDNDVDCCYVLWHDGSGGKNNKKHLTKTGRTIDISGLVFDALVKEDV